MVGRAGGEAGAGAARAGEAAGKRGVNTPAGGRATEGIARGVFSDFSGIGRTPSDSDLASDARTRKKP